MKNKFVCFYGLSLKISSSETWQKATIWETPHSDDCLQASWQGPSFPRITCSWICWPHLGDLRILGIQKRRGISPEVGYTNFQPVIFDMDLFGGKNVPFKKTWISQILHEPGSCPLVRLDGPDGAAGLVSIQSDHTNICVFMQKMNDATTNHVIIQGPLCCVSLFSHDFKEPNGTWHQEFFVTKLGHIKHYGLKIGVPNFWWDSASFLNSKTPEIT